MITPVTPDDLAGLLPPDQITHMVRVCTLEVAGNADIERCIADSPDRARAVLLELARLGLMPPSHATLIANVNKRTGKWYLSYQLTRDGILSAAARLGWSLTPVVVRKGEPFAMEGELVTHHARQPFSEAPIIGAYCRCVGPAGQCFDVTVDAAKYRLAAAASKTSFYRDHPVDGWAKVALSQAWKLIPDVPRDIQDAMASRAAESRPALPARPTRAPLMLDAQPAETPAPAPTTADTATEDEDL